MQPLSSGLNAKSIGKVSLNVSAPPTPSGGSTHFLVKWSDGRTNEAGRHMRLELGVILTDKMIRNSSDH